MNRLLAIQIGAMVSELGKLRSQIDEMPDPVIEDVLAQSCSVVDADHAARLSIAVLLASGLKHRAADPTALPSALLDIIEISSTILATIHRDQPERNVSRGEVLRMLADAADRSDARRKTANTALDKLLKLLEDGGFDTKVLRVPGPKPDDDGNNSNGGAN